MKASILLLLMISISVVYMPVNAQSGDNSVQIEFEFSPEPSYIQMMYDTTYIFSVKVVNMNLDIEKDDVVDPAEPHFKFSGNLVLDTTFTVRKEGSYQLGSESVTYNYTLDRRDESNDVLLPEISGFSSRWFSYSCTTGYEGKEVNLNEWLTFSIDVYAYIEEYREISGVKKYYLGELISEGHLKFYVITDEKVNYVDDALNSLNTEIDRAKNTIVNIENELNEEFDIDLTAYESSYNTMKAYFDEGDYVSAMTEYHEYNPPWKENMITLLTQRVESMKPYEQQLIEYSSQFSQLSTDYQTLQADYENFTTSRITEVNELRSELTSVKSNGRLYLFIITALVVVFTIIILRIYSRKS